MIDEIVRFAFLTLIERVFFAIGRLCIRGVTGGSVSLKEPSPLQVFLVALLGVFICVLIVVLLAFLLA